MEQHSMPKRSANARARGAHAPLCRGTPSMRAAGDACMVRFKLQMLLQTREHDVEYAIAVVVRCGCVEGGGGGQQQGRRRAGNRTSTSSSSSGDTSHHSCLVQSGIWMSAACGILLGGKTKTPEPNLGFKKSIGELDVSLSVCRCRDATKLDV